MLALTAVFVGGCGLLFTASGIDSMMRGQSDYGITWLGLLIGVLPGALIGLLAWMALKAAKATPPGG